MFNFIHNLLSKLYFTKPSVHYIQPKSLNLRFKTGDDNKYFWLNLQNLNSISPEIEQVKEDNNNSFLLKLNVQDKSGVNSIINVAKFETRTEAQTAFNVLVSKMSGPEKSVIKFALVLLAVAFLFGFAIDIFVVSSRNAVALSSASNNQAMVQNVPSKTAMTAQEQAKIIAELQKQAVPQAPQQPETPPPIPEQPQNSAVQGLIQGLGS